MDTWQWVFAVGVSEVSVLFLTSCDFHFYITWDFLKLILGDLLTFLHRERRS